MARNNRIERLHISLDPEEETAAMFEWLTSTEGTTRSLRGKKLLRLGWEALQRSSNQSNAPQAVNSAVAVMVGPGC